MAPRIRFTGPLAKSYPAAAAMVVFVLVPYLALSSAMTPLVPVLDKSLGFSRQGIELTIGMANAGYAIGTVLAIVLGSHLPQRRMLFLYSSLFVIASVMAALATGPAPFVAGHVLQGLLTSLMLIAAAPPLVTGWSAGQMRWTGMVMNLCIFGAVAAGPVIGGVQANAMSWRPLFWIIAGCGAIGWLFVVLTYEDTPPREPEAPWGLTSLLLAVLSSGAAFFGASELATHGFVGLLTFLPLVAGVGLAFVLVVRQYRARRPLMPVKVLATTIPVAGIIIALFAGASSFAAIDLIDQALRTATSPGHAGVLFLPEVGGALLTALLFAAVFRTRAVALLPLAGMVSLAGGIVIVTGVAGGPLVLVLIGSGLIGIGVGASVGPALFIAGFSAKSPQLPRVYALVELLRADAAFMTGPIIVHIAMTVSGGLKGGGIETAMWICFGIAAAGALIPACVWLLGRATLQAPDLETFLEGEQHAWHSPPLAAAIRREHSEPARRHAPERQPHRAGVRSR